jgi:hypothetical protein
MKLALHLFAPLQRGIAVHYGGGGVRLKVEEKVNTIFQKMR